MSSKPIVEVRDLGRVYHLYDNPRDRLKQAFLWGRRQLYREFWAVRGVSFDLAAGEAFGIIGRNGSGKSTVLQMVAGTIDPTEGSCEVRGTAAALLELGSGFNPEFSGRENVFLNGALLGLSRREIERQYDEIVDFAEIGDFIDQPVKTYSSGMVVRLAFAVQICVQPELLIIDEALSVGDIFFQQKCFKKIHEALDRGTALLFVSHDAASIRSLCKRALLLDSGTPVFVGDSEVTVSRYHATIGAPVVRSVDAPQKPATPPAQPPTSVAERDAIVAGSILREESTRHGGGGIVVEAVRVSNDSNIDTLSVDLAKPLDFVILLRAVDSAPSPSAGIHLYDRMGTLVFAAGTRQLGYELPNLDTGAELIVKLRLFFTIQPGQYTFSIGTSEPSGVGGPDVGHIQDLHEDLGPIEVLHDPQQPMPFFGVARLEMEASHKSL